MSNVVRIRDLASHAGETVTVEGWLYNRRSSKKLHFLQLRDGSGIVQCIATLAHFGEERFPEIGAIVHVHAWLEGVDATQQSWPCGTVELAEEVLALVERQPDPAQAEVGLRNHGLTLTGAGLPEIFARVEGRLVREVPPT